MSGQVGMTMVGVTPTAAPGSYECGEPWATCPAGKPYCYWGDKTYNRGRCCTKPWGTDCVAPTAPSTAVAVREFPASDGTKMKRDKKDKKHNKNKKSKDRKSSEQTPATFAAPLAAAGDWNKATATWYTSYPECCHDKSVDQTECEDYSGCKWEGMFAAFDDKKPKSWVESNNIVAFYASPNSQNRKEWDKKWKNKQLVIRNPKTGKELQVTVVDTCDDSDCSGCCSKNANKNGGFLIDLEKNTAQRFYDGNVEDLTAIEWRAI